MSKTFIATILAGAIAVTSFSAVPARAELTDFEKILLGVGTMVIIGTAIEESKQSQKKKEKKEKKAHSKKVVKKAAPKKIVRAAPKPKRLAPLPAYCLRSVSSHNGPRQIFGARCLQNNYQQTHRLPHNCKVEIQGPRGSRYGYGQRCLRRSGFQVN